MDLARGRSRRGRVAAVVVGRAPGVVGLLGLLQVDALVLGPVVALVAVERVARVLGLLLLLVLRRRRLVVVARSVGRGPAHPAGAVARLQAASPPAAGVHAPEHEEQRDDEEDDHAGEDPAPPPVPGAVLVAVSSAVVVARRAADAGDARLACASVIVGLGRKGGMRCCAFEATYSLLTTAASSSTSGAISFVLFLSQKLYLN